MQHFPYPYLLVVGHEDEKRYYPKDYRSDYQHLPLPRLQLKVAPSKKGCQAETGNQVNVELWYHGIISTRPHIGDPLGIFAICHAIAMRIMTNAARLT